MLLRRLLHHMNGFYRLCRYWDLLASSGRKFFGCVTVDMDAHGYSQAFDKGIPFLLSLYEALGLEGKVTWFANVREDLSEKYLSILQRILDSGSEVGMHSHLEELSDPDDKEEVKARLKGDKIELEGLLEKSVIGFRSGCLFRTPAIMQSLSELGFHYDSSFTFGRVFRIRGRLVDDSRISGRDSVFQLPGGPLEFPVWEPYPNPVMIEGSSAPYFITTLVHPYNLVCMGRLNPLIQFYYDSVLKMLSRVPGIEFVSLGHALKIWNTQAS